MTKIGLFFGSFNPVHIGHLIIAEYMANYTDLDEVWFVVSPLNPFKKKASLSNMYDRLEMVNLAIEDAVRLRSSDVEFHLPRPSYTADTLTHLRERHPEKSFVLIMGSDNLLSLKKWKNAAFLLQEYAIYVYPRPGFDTGDWNEHPAVTITDTPLMELSASFIRNAIKSGKSVRFFLPPKVLEFVDKKGLFLT